MIHKFNDSLKVGQRGEELYHKAKPFLQRTDGRKHDFVDLQTGDSYELKSDSYDMHKTENFFIEVMSNVDTGKVGGPLQAALNGTKYWVYMFTGNKTTFTFETEKLVLWLQDYLLNNKPPVIFIQNKSWCTTGHKIPRKLLQHLYVEEKLK